jgi:hypothetical protein
MKQPPEQPVGATQAPKQQRNDKYPDVFKSMVDAVGIEPTTSRCKSRIMRITPKVSFFTKVAHIEWLVAHWLTLRSARICPLEGYKMGTSAEAPEAPRAA